MWLRGNGASGAGASATSRRREAPDGSRRRRGHQRQWRHGNGASGAGAGAWSLAWSLEPWSPGTILEPGAPDLMGVTRGNGARCGPWGPGGTEVEASHVWSREVREVA